jgi:hypothetical protein
MRVRYERSVGTNGFDLVNDGLVSKRGKPKGGVMRLLCGSIPKRSETSSSGLLAFHIATTPERRPALPR